MKAKLLCPILAGIALVGCVKEEMLNHNTKVEQKIAFEAPLLYDNVESKAPVPGEINGTIYPAAEKFIIYAAQHSGDFVSWPAETTNLPVGSTGNGLTPFNGQTLERNSTFDAWVPTYEEEGADGKTYTRYYYWPIGKKLSFGAMSPAELECTKTYGPEGLTIEGYTVPEIATEQIDVMFAKRLTNQTADNMVSIAGSYSGIQLQFQHALSSIHFSVSKASVEHDVQLTEIKLTNIYGSGNFSEGIEEGATLYERNGDDPTVVPVWETTGNILTDGYVSFTGNIDFPVSPRYVTDIVDEFDSEQLNNTSAPLLIIPQEISEETELVVKYIINDQPQEKSYKLKGLMTLTTGGIEDSVNKGEAINEWKVGHKYTYRLHYSAESATDNIIMFGPNVTDWTNVQIIQLEL